MRLIIIILLLPILTGCYCFKTIPTTSSIRHLRTSKTSSLCDDWIGGGGRSVQVNAYYGFPSTVKNNYDKAYDIDLVENYEFSTIGQFGLRAEKYLPSFVTPFRVLGVGIDYSQAYVNLQYTNLNGTQETVCDFTHYRAMLSINHMTWVKRRLIGYLTFQGGINMVKRKSISGDPNFQFQNVFNPVNFAYRGGYGFQYYLKGPWAVSIEGGYAGGAYVRVGFLCWVF